MNNNFLVGSVGLALVLSAHFTPVLAQSNVSVAGMVDASLVSSNSSGSRLTSLESGSMQTSFLQFSGVEQLGTGLKAKFLIGSYFRVDTGASGRFNGDPLLSRDANLGLESDVGTLTLGRQINPLYISTLVFNPFGDSFRFSPMINQFYNNFGAGGIAAGGDSGYSNAISYSLPNINGLRATLIYSLSEKSGVSGTIGGNAMYFNGPLGASVAYEKYNQPVVFGGVSQTVYQLGISYDLSKAKVFGQYQNTKDSASYNTYQMGVSVPLGIGNVLASYARTDGLADVRTFSLGYDYNLSKRTDLYALYVDNKVWSKSANALGLGVRYRF